MAEFQTPGRVSLHVQNPEGYVEVQVHDEPRTVVDLLPLSDGGERAIEAAGVNAQQRGDEHVVEVELPSKGRLSFRSSPVGVRVLVPEGTSLTASTASADLTARATLMAADVRTASGDVQLDDVDVEASDRNASGDIPLGRVGDRAR